MQTERVAAWRELARRLAHELKNPLFPLQLTVENLSRARALPAAEFDEIFDESTGTLLAEIHQPENDHRSLQRLLEDAEAATATNFAQRSRAAGGNATQAQLKDAPNLITLNVEFDRSLREIPLDPDLMHRVVSNLFLNAIDAMPEGGTLTLRTRDRGEQVRLEVSDTGVGLTPEERERIFTPYYTTKKHGTGLGLAVVQSIVSDHLGSNQRSQRARAGHDVYYRSAQASQRFGGCERTDGSDGVSTTAKADILIVDDEANTLASLSRAFRLAGHEATVCDNSARALELAQSRPFDLILSDVVMPNRDGLALLEDLKTQGVQSPVVMMSGQAHIDMAVKATRLGALDFLEKPISTDKLLLTVENALKLKRLESENRDLQQRVGKHEIIWKGETMRRLMAQIERVASSESRVCIFGETGTGKELVARTLHAKSPRRNGPVRHAELRGGSSRADRVGAVRSRERFVYGRGQSSRGQI